jgi:hypothetical protein
LAKDFSNPQKTQKFLFPSFVRVKKTLPAKGQAASAHHFKIQNPKATNGPSDSEGDAPNRRIPASDGCDLPALPGKSHLPSDPVP